MPAEGRPALTPRLIIRDVRCESRLRQTMEPLDKIAPSSSHLCSKLGGQVHIDQAGDAIAAEEAATPLRAPDDAGIDDRTGLYLFIGPDLYIGLHNRPILDNRVIANDRPFEHNGFALNRG